MAVMVGQLMMPYFVNMQQLAHLYLGLLWNHLFMHQHFLHHILVVVSYARFALDQITPLKIACWVAFTQLQFQCLLLLTVQGILISCVIQLSIVSAIHGTEENAPMVRPATIVTFARHANYHHLTRPKIVSWPQQRASSRDPTWRLCSRRLCPPLSSHSLHHIYYGYTCSYSLTLITLVYY